jgi:hypothetical protein
MPPSNFKILLAAGWFAFYGCYLAWTAFALHHWLPHDRRAFLVGALGVLALAGAAGVIVRWHGSQWLVYGVAVLIVGYWLYMFLMSIRAGDSFQSAPIIALIVVVAATTWSADTVRRRFRRAADRA